MEEGGIRGAGSGIFFRLGVSGCVVEVVAQRFVSLVVFGGFDGFGFFLWFLVAFLVVF